MKKFKQRAKFVAPLLIFALVFAGGFLAGKTLAPTPFLIPEISQTEQELGADFGIFWDVWRLIKSKYKEADSLNPQEMVYGAIGGLVDSLDDPYSEFLPPEVSRRFMEDIKGSFEGIGAEIGMKNNFLTVIAPLEGTPAKRAGLRSGDKIIKIDEQLTLDINLEEAVNLIRGPKGTKVKLTVLRENNGKQEEIEITRGIIKVPVASWSLKDKGRIAHVQLFNFTEGAPDDFSKIVQEILNSSAEKLILDLRGNPGGYLEAAVDIAGWFLDYGDKVVTEDSGEGKKVYLAKGRAGFKDWPIVVLINEGTASASEILAGALRDNLGVRLIGKNSFGKGSVQEMTTLKGGASLKLTIADWITPNGLFINEAGLKPDLEVDLTQEDLGQNRDPQLEKAMEYLSLNFK